MKKVVSAILLLACSSFVNAGTGLNCSEEDVLSNPDNLEICIDQSNDWLNGTYKQLQARHKGEKSKLEALKKMQLGWIQMRDNQCSFQSLNSAGGGGAALTEMRCIVQLTLKRNDELEQF